MKTTKNKSFICFRENNHAQKKLICFPPAGCGASFYSKWHQRLPSNVEVWSFQLPGREFLAHKKLPTSFDELMNIISDEIPELLDGSASLYGHSFGAAMAFYTALQVEKKSSLEHVFLAARKPISTIYSAPPSELNDQDLMDYIQALGGSSPVLAEDPTLMKKYLTLLRNDLFLNEKVSKKIQKIHAPITFFYTKNDIALTINEAELWKSVTSSQFRLYCLEGDHFFVNNPRHSCYNIISMLLNGSSNIDRLTRENTNIPTKVM